MSIRQNLLRYGLCSLLRVGALLGCFLVSAGAADLGTRAPPPITVEPETFHPFQITLRATGVVPDGHTNLQDVRGDILPLLGLSSGPGSNIFYSGLNVAQRTVPTLGINYYFSKNWAVEVICCVTNHKITGTGFLNDLQVGQKWLFPPTLTLQYHFTNFGSFQPYIGVGATYTRLFGGNNGGAWSPFYTKLGFTGYNSVQSLSLNEAWGVTGQVGFDIMMDDHWGVNFDAKRMLMEPYARANVFNSLLAAYIPVKGKVNIDPWLVSAGIAYRFGASANAPIIAKY